MLQEPPATSAPPAKAAATPTSIATLGSAASAKRHVFITHTTPSPYASARVRPTEVGRTREPAASLLAGRVPPPAPAQRLAEGEQPEPGEEDDELEPT